MTDYTPSGEWVYAWTAAEQINPNKKNRNKWNDVSKIISGVDGAGYSNFARKDKTRSIPYYMALYDYQLNIPEKAYIKKIIFRAKMKTDFKKLKIPVPYARFCFNGTNKNMDEVEKGTTGWYNKHWCVWLDEYLTTSKVKYDFEMPHSALKEINLRANDLMENIFGVDLIFQKAEDKNYSKDYDKNVYLYWVGCKVDYELPNYNITYEGSDILNMKITKNGVTTYSPVATTGKEFTLIATFNNTTYGYGGTQVLDVTFPHGTEIVSVKATGGSSYDATTKQWTVDGDGKSRTNQTTQTLVMKLVSHDIGNNTITIGNDEVGYFNFDHVCAGGLSSGSSEIIVGSDGEYHAGETVCKTVNIVGNTNQAYGVYPVYLRNSQNYAVNNVELLPNNYGVMVHPSMTIENGIVLQVTPNSLFDVDIKVCYTIPPDAAEDTNTFTVQVPNEVSSTQTVQTYKEVVLDPYSYHLSLSKDSFTLNNHRVYSKLESNVTMIDLVANENDASMIQSGCNLNVDIKEEIDYIGCVPLEHSHYDPESTYEDTLLDKSYKNKKYMGKKLAADETITLNVKLRPRQVTTIQGLIDMDKPIPINASHRCFEGDSLNHRGWAEIYKIKNTKTNPLWRDCEIDVKYLTHNLDSRFKIHRGKPIESSTVPSMISEVFSSGESLSDTDYFDVITDGTYLYDSEEDSTARNQFNLANNQYFNITTHNPLASTSHVSFKWDSSMLTEVKENYIARKISLYDKKGEVFSYEYFDIKFYDSLGREGTDSNYLNNAEFDFVKCQVKATVREGNDMADCFTDTMQLSVMETLLNTDEDLIETDGDEEIYYGSLVHFEITDNLLKVVDEGFSRQEVIHDNIKLDGEGYYWKVEFKNLNSDDNSNVDFYVDFEVSDTVLLSDFANQYSTMFIAPFPVADKKLLFTRDTPEGVLYYYQDDSEEFSYIIEPYYQYLNGCDLVHEGESILNLNYAYRLVYIQNGLVRLGFNRLTGTLYLGKYNKQYGDYMTTNTLQLSKYDDININSISDDKIEIQASDSVFTIYRGHPYIVVNHETEDIQITDRFTEVWAEAVDGTDALELPTYWDLENNSNILPSNIGGDRISDEDLEVTTREVTTRADSNISVSYTYKKDGATVTHTNNELYLGETIVATISGTAQNSTYDILGTHGNTPFGSFSLTEITNPDAPNRLSLSSKDIIQAGETTNLFGRLTNWDGEGISGKTVYFFETFEPNTLDLTSDKDIIQVGQTANISATLKDEDGSRVEGQTVYFFVRE